MFWWLSLGGRGIAHCIYYIKQPVVNTIDLKQIFGLGRLFITLQVIMVINFGLFSVHTWIWSTCLISTAHLCLQVVYNIMLSNARPSIYSMGTPVNPQKGNMVFTHIPNINIFKMDLHNHVQFQLMFSGVLYAKVLTVCFTISAIDKTNRNMKAMCCTKIILVNIIYNVSMPLN